jgi:hypothetical protein
MRRAFFQKIKTNYDEIFNFKESSFQGNNPKMVGSFLFLKK